MRNKQQKQILACVQHNVIFPYIFRRFYKGIPPSKPEVRFKKFYTISLADLSVLEKEHWQYIHYSAVKDLLEHVESALSHQFRSLSSKYLYSNVNPSLLRWIQLSKSKNMYEPCSYSSLITLGSSWR